MVPVFSYAEEGFARLLRLRRAAHPPRRRPVQPTQHPVDIVLPVFRSLADTQQCVESVLASPVGTPYRLIVINDASPEPELAAWLRKRAAEDKRIVLLENPENVGFVETVNRGMSLHDLHDVLILNSDTEVANDWLDRMRAAAYADARIATVTPFSTNATICSYPRFCQGNLMPAGFTTARLDALCARTNPAAVVDVPTGVGFCMYIRRACLQEIGLFDTTNFGQGYGEENDFCQRAAAAGWRNLHLLDTFVLHTGGVSFGDSKQPREKAAMQALRRLHPRYERDVLRFAKADPARPARLALDIARIRDSGLPVVLAVVHNRLGGTIRHVRELARHLAGQAVFLMLMPTAGKRALLRLADEAESFELVLQLPEQYEVLRTLGVQHIHFHHLLGHEAVVRELPRLLDLAYDFTVHDYYSYCTNISLTGKQDRFLGETAPGECVCCMPDMPGPDGAGTVAQWRNANASMLRGARRVLVPSHDAARRIAAFAPGAPVLVVGHTDMPPAANLPEPVPASLPAQAPLNVVVLGALSAIKGADVLETTALEAARRDSPIQFHLLGYGYRPLKTLPIAHLTVYGEYKEEELLDLLTDLKPDVAWFPAQWPETYSYTLSAVLKAGLPVVVSDIGALAERVQGRAWSWIRPWNASPMAWLDDFIAIRQRYFIPCTPPTLLESQGSRIDTSPTPGTTWSYDRDYLTNLRAAPQDGTLIGATELEPYLSRERMTTRLRVLAALTYLRSHPMLSGIVHSIPAHWRQRVNDWLNA